MNVPGPTLAGLSAGSYTITIEDVSGCLTTVNTTVNEPTIVNGSIANTIDVSCNGGNDGSFTVIGSGGISPYQYSIDGESLGKVAEHLVLYLQVFILLQ